MTSIKACLFDLDGVLVDTAKYHYLAWKRLADELGFEFTEQDNERLKGVSRMASLDILLSVGGVELDEAAKLELAERKNNWYFDMISKMDDSEILPGALEFLKDCRENGLKVALGSASKNAMTILNNTGLTPYFDAIIDGTRTTSAKPDPEVFTLGATELGVSPDECVVFEDAEAGIEAAQRAGMRSVGIGSPCTLGKANLVIASLGDITVDRLLSIAAV
ncbi:MULTISPECIES: beta-phosphoglucomutase [Paenibacillus]|uniref:Beta-phosphoglucomutase n=1 Tax=Paenibacillus vini TaxID=1476024 RepID=A0ABQ4M9U4_9BACL|nr:MULTISPECIES: beta-phosphoglucomutase [Paenibacillus]MBQ4899667.1 beta-phosphoglucomutase [Paenibacillus sp. Marseille-P2973]MDN4069623.1 beta-phosphoglucomutase [Paenibacillus vini]GIP52757.1 beta-phosphoglucomutase [Paenibacillus vini]